MLPVVSQVASTLQFNPSLEYLADRVASYITRNGRRRFNGAHLRVEKDAAEWFIILGGPEVRLALLRALARAPALGLPGQVLDAADCCEHCLLGARLPPCALPVRPASACR